MAPNVILHIFRDNDLNGIPLAVITDEDEYFKGLKINPQRDGLGSGEVLLARNADLSALDEDSFRAEYFVRLIVSAYSDTIYYPWGFSFTKRQLVTVHKDEDGGEEFRLGGPGPKWYLDRAIMGIGSPSTGWALDLDNGEWRFNDQASVGRIMLRAIQQDSNEDAPALPALTTTFTAANDSNGDPWSESDLSGGDELYIIPIGTHLLTVLYDLDDSVELTSWIDLGTVAAPKFELNIIEGLGDDNMGSAFGAGVCLLKEGVNIADNLETEGISLKKVTHVVIEGRDGVWAEQERSGFVPGSYVKREKIEFTRTAHIPWLERVGLRWLRKQDYGEKEITVEILPGNDDLTGLYFPAPDRVLWLSNLISLKTSADGGSTIGHLDYQHDEEQLVTGFELELGPAGDTTDATAKTRSWDVKVQLNKQRSGTSQRAPDQRSATSGGGGCKCIKLCHAAVQPEAAAEDQFLNANDPGGTNPDWQGLLGNQGGSGGGANGTDWYNFKSAGSPSQYQHSRACTPGQTISISGWWGCRSDGHLVVAYTTAPTGSSSASISAGLIDTDDLHADGPGHSHSNEWTPFAVSFTIPPTTVSYALGHSGDDINFDEVTVTLGGDPEVASNLLDGTEAEAARCDHKHHVISETDPTVDDDESLGYRVGTIWLTVDDADNPTALTAMFVLLDNTDGAAVWDDITPGGSGGAPTTADYLVGTAQAGLSGEIVVGTTPGGELGGTWASPTVDATHSGSAHHAEDHHTRHEAGGADKIKLDDLEPPDDNTDLNASTSKHGLLKKLPNDATKYLDGTGNYTDPGLAGGSTGNVIATPSGSAVRIPGLDLGDRKPSSAGTYDEEFDGTADTLPTNWAWVSAPSGSDTWTLNSRWPSLLTVEGTGATTYTLKRTSFSAAATFGIWFKVSIGPATAADITDFRLYVSDSAETARRGVNLRATGSNAIAPRSLKIVAGSETQWGSGGGINQNEMYLGLTRDSNNWAAWCSTNGVSWFNCGGTESHTFTVDRVYMSIKTASTPSVLTLDWMRYRTDTAFPRP